MSIVGATVRVDCIGTGWVGTIDDGYVWVEFEDDRQASLSVAEDVLHDADWITVQE